MTKKHLCLAVYAAVLAALCLHVPEAWSQSTSATTPIEMVTVDRSGRETRLRSLDGVMEPVGLPAGDQIAITLEASTSKAGQPVSVRLLDGGEIVASPALSVATDGTVGFTFNAGDTGGLYRVEVTLGTDQYELQLYAVPHASNGAGVSLGNDNPTGVTGDYNGSVTTGGSYDPYTGNAKRFVTDLTVTGSLGAYPLKWSRVLNTRVGGAGGGDGFARGPWRHCYNWVLWLRQWRPDPPGETMWTSPSGILHYPDGRRTEYDVDSANQYTQRSLEPGDLLVPAPGLPYGHYDLLLADGGRVEFRWDTPPGFQTSYTLKAKRIVDPHGLATELQYDPSNGRLLKIIEPGGRYLEIEYETFQYWVHPPWGNGWHYTTVIRRVKAFAGAGRPETERVTYEYVEEISPDGLKSYKLDHVDYADEAQAFYTYFPVHALPAPPNFILPPEGVLSGRIRTCDDPRFAGAMGKIEYDYLISTENHNRDVVVGQIQRELYPGTPSTIVSEVIYPLDIPISETLAEHARKEKRPDGSIRSFQYWNDGSGELMSYTDFKNQTSTIDWPGPEYTRRVEDARGNKTAVQREWSVGAVKKITHPGGAYVLFSHSDPNKPYYVASKTDENEKVTYYDRDSANRVWRIRYPDDAVERFTYTNNPFGLVYEHYLTGGGKEVFEYDNRGLKTAYTPPATLSVPNPEEHKTLYFYYGGPSGPGMAPSAAVRPDLIDRLRRVIDPRDNSTWYEYNPRGQVTKVTYPDGHFTQSHYNHDGTLDWTADEMHPGAVSDPNQRTRYEYDEYKRVTRIINPMGKETRNDYTPPPVNGVTLSPLSHTTSSVYHVTSHLGKVIEYDYDANFRRERMTVAPWTADAATTTYTYDEVGNLQTVKDPKGQTTGRVTIYTYDPRNRRESVTDALNHKTEWLYDDAGNMKKETRADTKFRTWDVYDAMNRIKQTTGFLGERTSYNYDLAGNMTHMTDHNGGIYQTIYDELNRKKTSIYPNDASGASRSESWRYDFAGNLKWYKNPAYQIKHFEYDARNRPRRSYWNSSTTDETTVAWSVGPETTTTLDAAGRVMEIKTNGGETKVAFGYDHANRKIWEDQTVAGLPTRRVETNPDDDGNRGTLSVPGVPGAYSFTYQYTQRQQLRHINRGGSPYVEYSYDVNDNLQKRQHMAQGQGHDSTRFQYDDINRVTQCEQTGHNDQLFARSNYNDYDLVNNLKSILREEDGNKGELFTYDDANQLQSVSYKADIDPRAPEPGGDPGVVAAVGKDVERESVAALEADPDREPLARLAAEPEPEAPIGPRTVIYTNDAINRLRMRDGATGQTTDYTPNHLNQYTAVTGQGTLSYDEKFNLSSYDGWTYVYDAEKRLVSASTAGHNAQFVYDGLGRCVKRTIDGAVTLFTYDEWKPIVEWTGAGAFVAWNLYGPGADEILVRYQPNTGGHVHYHLDALGNVQFLLSGELHLGLEKYTYDVFGKPTITGWNGGPRAVSLYGNRFLFTGREYLYTLGIYDYRHRKYHPRLGRFMQVDPIGFKGDALNLYRYCGANPVNHRDPLGLVSGFTKYELEYDKNEKHDDTHDGYQVKGVKGTEEGPGGVHLEVNRTVTRAKNIGDDKGGGTTVTTDVSNKNGVPTIHSQIDVRYASGAGEGTKTHSQNYEWTHGRDAITSVNSLRGRMEGWTKSLGMSGDKAVNFIRNGAQISPQIRIPSLKSYDQQFNRSQFDKWDNPYGPNSWRAPNGQRVAPHTPIDPYTGNPIRWDQ